jgi:histidinol-phosphatase
VSRCGTRKGSGSGRDRNACAVGVNTIEFGPAWSASLRRGPEAELRGWVDAALAWCVETDAIAMKHFRRDLGIRQKPDRSFVTVADTAVEERLRDKIAAAFPKHGVLGEELGEEGAAASTRWIIDPIDGTHNYMRGVPIFGTLLAVERDGELQAAVISAPALRTRWAAWRGGGAWAMSTIGGASPRRLSVSQVDAPEEAYVLFTSESEIGRSGLMPGLRRVLDGAWRERGFGDFWSYTLVAEGAAEAMVEVEIKPWDAAAPFLLVEEAGGRATDIDGNRSIRSSTFIASNGLFHDAIRARLLEATEESA